MQLTLPQQDIYFEQLLFPDEPIYNIGAKIEIDGALNIEIFNKAYVALINSHDAYRSVITKNNEDVSISLVNGQKSELGFVDFSKSSNPIEEANTYMQKEFTKPFDLLSGTFLHVFTLLKVQEDFYYLFSVYHHIITDGWGTSLMFQRLVQNYNEISEHGEIISEYPFTYKTFAEDDLQYQDSAIFKQDLEYWFEKFKDLPENLLEKCNDTTQKNKSSRKELVIKRNIYNQLNALASEYKCSTFHLILGVLYVYFGRKYDNKDFAIGLPVLNRNKSVYKKTVGLFMGISPLRMSLDFNATFQDLMTDIRDQLRQDYRHQRLPLGKLVQKLQLYTQKERLFNITLSYEKQDYATHFINTLTKVIPLSHQSERAALAIYIREFDESKDVTIDFDYNLNYFTETSITQVISHFKKILAEILEHPEKKLSELRYLTKKEEHELIFGFNQTKQEYRKNITLLDLFYEQVSALPQKVAVKDGTKCYSYSELDKLSNQIAAQIISKYGKEDKSPVAVLLERSTNMIAVLLGILKTGRSYIPLDPVFPSNRLRYIVANSQTNIIIYEKNYNIEELGAVTAISLENILQTIGDYNICEFGTVSPDDTAYIIYTSGSTGKPKGVEIGHKSLLNFLTSIRHKPGIISDDILFSVTTHSFDISILEFFVPLVSGATLFIARQDLMAHPELILKSLNELKPTIIQGTPSFFQMLLNADWHLNYQLKIFCGGDLLSESLAEKLIDCSSELWNMYGPTETTIWSGIKKIDKASEANNIGKPISNTQFYILDEFLYPKPIGTPGDIYIAGDGLAKGYYKNVALTREKFIQNPFDATSLFYMTGDIGKFNSNGEIEFLGRSDNQVKIRGYRIELGDIEAQLNQIEEIKDSVVIAKKSAQQESYLVAYILKSDGFQGTSVAVGQLKKTLPDYMIPYVIIPLEEFPLTLNQKIDRKSLSERNILQNINYDDHQEPASDLENKLSDYFRKVLNTEEALSAKANFFALGGHSLNAVKLIGLISKNLFFEVTLRTIFENPTIASLAAYLQQQNPTNSNQIPLSETRNSYHLTPAQYAIWLASQESKVSIAYNMSAGFCIEGNIDTQKINKSVNKIIEKYEVLRTNFVEMDAIPKQKINTFKEVNFQITIQQPGNDTIKQIIDKFINTEFNLETDLLIRMQLIKLEIDQYLLLFSTHHIIMDGLSLEIFIKEFIRNYDNESEIRLDEQPLKLQFRDYSEWFTDIYEENKTKDELFWEEYLKYYLPKDAFARDFDIKNNNHTAGQLSFELSEEVVFRLKQSAAENQATFYTLLVTSLNVLINMMSKQADICIGVIDSGRNIPVLNDQIGMFAKTFALRTRIQPGQTFKELLCAVNSNLLTVRDSFQAPFDKVGHSLFDVMLVYQNPEFDLQNGIVLNELKLTPYSIDIKFCRMPLVFNLFESNLKLKGLIEYNVDLFEKDTIEVIISKFIRILEEIALYPDIKLAMIDYRSEQEKNSAFDFDFNF